MWYGYGCGGLPYGNGFYGCGWGRNGSKSTLSILGLYQYDNTVLDGLRVPGDLDIDTCKNNLLIECADYEVVYPNPELMRIAIQNWCQKEYPIWEHLWETTQYEYNPIENYDRNEWSHDVNVNDRHKINADVDKRIIDETDIKDFTGNIKRDKNATVTDDFIGKISDDFTGKVTDTFTGKIVDTLDETKNTTVNYNENQTETRNLTGSDNNSMAHKIASFNVNTPVLDAEQTDNRDTTDKGTIKIDKNGTQTTKEQTDNTDTTNTNNSNIQNTNNINVHDTKNDNIQTTKDTQTEDVVNKDLIDKNVKDNYNSDRDEKENDKNDNEHWARAHGNIGVTTTQQMIEQEREIAQFSVYNYIIDSFKKRFCLLIG